MYSYGSLFPLDICDDYRPYFSISLPIFFSLSCRNDQKVQAWSSKRFVLTHWSQWLCVWGIALDRLDMDCGFESHYSHGFLSSSVLASFITLSSMPQSCYWECHKKSYFHWHTELKRFHTFAWCCEAFCAPVTPTHSVQGFILPARNVLFLRHLMHHSGKLAYVLFDWSWWCNGYRACHWTQSSWVQTQSRAMDF
jgi:hypothetical protein